MTVNLRSIQVYWWVVVVMRVAKVARYDDKYILVIIEVLAGLDCMCPRDQAGWGRGGTIETSVDGLCQGLAALA